MINAVSYLFDAFKVTFDNKNKKITFTENR